MFGLRQQKNEKKITALLIAVFLLVSLLSMILNIPTVLAENDPMDSNQSVVEDYDGNQFVNGGTTLITFKDAELTKAIQEALSVTETSFDEMDLRSITTLTISSDKTVSDLDGLQYLVNLEEITFSGNFIGNDLSHLFGLQNLKKFKHDGSDFGISDLAQFTQMPALEVLELRIVNDHFDCSDLSSLDLTELALIGQSNHQYYTVDPSTLIHLKKLTLVDIYFYGALDLSQLSALEELVIVDSDITRIPTMHADAPLARITLNGNYALTDFTAMTLYSNTLKVIDLMDNQLEDISFIEDVDLVHVDYLNLSYNKISNIEVFRNKTRMTPITVVLDHNYIWDFSPLSVHGHCSCVLLARNQKVYLSTIPLGQTTHYAYTDFAGDVLDIAASNNTTDFKVIDGITIEWLSVGAKKLELTNDTANKQVSIILYQMVHEQTKPTPPPTTTPKPSPEVTPTISPEVTPKPTPTIKPTKKPEVSITPTEKPTQLPVESAVPTPEATVQPTTQPQETVVSEEKGTMPPLIVQALAMLSIALGSAAAAAGVMSIIPKPVGIQISSIVPNGDGSHTVTVGLSNPNKKAQAAGFAGVKVLAGAALILKNNTHKELAAGASEEALVVVVNEDSQIEVFAGNKTTTISGRDL